MIEETVDVHVELDDRFKVSYKTMQVKVNPCLGSLETIEYLDQICDAPSESLMLTQCAIFVEFLWQK